MSEQEETAGLTSETEPDETPPPAAGFRTYEVFQRERVGETTNLIRPRALLSEDYLADPYPSLTVLREHYPCYREWAGNRFWITRYDDVTSVFVDDANFETRSKQWFYGIADPARDLRAEVDVAWARTRRIDEHLPAVVDAILGDLRTRDVVDLATDFAARLALELWRVALDLPDEMAAPFARCYLRVQRGAGWSDVDRGDGLRAIGEMEQFLEPLFTARRTSGGTDMISAVAGHEADRPTSTADLVATILEWDHETLHGTVANLLFLLLTHPEQLQLVRDEPRLLKFAWLEAVRHSPPVLSARRFARREVERFGRLLPEGALVQCSAAAANRDPRVFEDPDVFMVGRKDLCQREPRGQYRADGLPSGISFGTGKPSMHPAVPRERPRSEYALLRDVAVMAVGRLLDEFPALGLAAGAEPTLRSLRLGEMRTCWALPVTR